MSGKNVDQSGLLTCIIKLNSEKITERKKQMENLQIYLRRNHILKFLDEETDLRKQNRKKATLTWDKIFKAAKHFLFMEAERLREKNVENLSTTAKGNVERDKKLCSAFIKFIVKQANGRGPRLQCTALVDHVMEVLKNAFLCSTFGLDHTSILLKEVLCVPQMYSDISLSSYKKMISYYSEIILSPPHGWNRVLLAQVLHRLINTSSYLYDWKIQSLCSFFTSIFKQFRVGESTSHLEVLLLSLVEVSRIISFEYRSSLCHLGENIFMPLLCMWNSKPSSDIKDLVMEFFRVQLALHHPKGVTSPEEGAFAYDWAEWKNQLTKLYNMFMLELQSFTNRTKYSPGNEQSLKSCVVSVGVEVCHQLFSSGTTSLDITQLSATPHKTGSVAKKRRRVEIGVCYVIETLQSLPASFEIIPWLQFLSSFLKKYPKDVSVEDITSILDLLLQIHQTCKHLEVKTWLLQTCQSLVSAYCVLRESGVNSVNRKNNLSTLWEKLWNLSVKSVALNQCHGQAHGVLFTILFNELVIPKADFYSLYAAGSSNRLSKASLQTLAVYLQKYTFPVYPHISLSSLSSTVSGPSNKYYYRHQFFEWLFPINEDPLSRTESLSLKPLDITVLEIQARLLAVCCLQDGKYLLQKIVQEVNSTASQMESEEWKWINNLEIHLLQQSFHMPFTSWMCKTENVSSEKKTIQKIIEPVWEVVQNSMMKVSSQLFDLISHSVNISLTILMEQAFMMSSVLKNLWKSEALLKENLKLSPLTKQIKHLLEPIADSLMKIKSNVNPLKKEKNEKTNQLLFVLHALGDIVSLPNKEFGKREHLVISEWIISFIPENLIELLRQVACFKDNQLGSEVSEQLFRISNEPSTSHHEISRCPLDEDFDIEDSGCKSPTDDDDLFDKVISDNMAKSEDVKLLDVEACSVPQKIQLQCVDVLCSWCYCCSSCQYVTEYAPESIIKQILASLDYKSLNLSIVFNLQLVLKVIDSLIHSGCLGDDEVDCILNLTRSVLKKYHKDQDISVKCLQQLSGLCRILSTNSLKKNTEKTINNRNHLLHLIYRFWEMNKEHKCSRNKALTLAETMATLIKVDPSREWARWQSEDEGHEKYIHEEFLSFFSSSHYRLHMFAAEEIKYLFHSENGENFTFSRQQESFNDIYKTTITSLQSLRKESAKTEEEKQEISANRTNTLLASLTTVALSSCICEAQVIFALCQVTKENGISVLLVAKVLRQMSKLLGYQSLKILMESHFPYLINEWLIQKYPLHDFPFQFLQCETLSDFYRNHYQTIIPMLLQFLDFSTVKSLGSELKCDWQKLLKDCLPCILSHNLPWFALHRSNSIGSTEKLQNAIKCHQELENMFSKAVLETTLMDHLEEVVVHFLTMVHEDSLKECGDSPNNTMLIPLPNPPYFPKSTIISTLHFLKESCSLQETTLIALLAQKQDGIQKILLSLHVQLHKSHRIHEQRRVILMYHLFSELLLPELKSVGDCYLFIIRNLIFTMINFMSVKRPSTVDEEALYVLCCDLIAKVCQATATSFSEDIGTMLPIIVSSVIPFGEKNSKLGQSVLNLLCFLIIENNVHLAKFVTRLDPFPDSPTFEVFKNRHLQLMYKNGPYSLEQEISHFLYSYQSTRKGTVESLCHLRSQLSEKKSELQAVLGRLQEKQLFSEDIAISAIHQLVSTLIHMCTSGDEQVQREACYCLGELGPVDLSTTIFHPYTHLNKQDDIHNELARMNPLYKSYCVIFELLSSYLQDKRIDVVSISANVLKKSLSTKTGYDFVAAYKPHGKFFLYLHPFCQGKKSTPERKLIPPTPEVFSQIVNDAELWTPSHCNYSEWITSLVSALLKTGASCDEIFQELIPVCQMEVTFCEQLLPHLIYAILLQGSEDFRQVLSHQIGCFFSKHSAKNFEDNLSELSTSLSDSGDSSFGCIYMCKASVQAMLSVIHHLRLNPRPCPRNQILTSWDNNFWLEVDYLQVAQAAQFCSAHFTAVLYTEIWWDAVIREREKSNEQLSESESQGSSLFGVRNFGDQGKVNRLLLDAYSSIGDPDGVYGFHRISPDDKSLYINYYTHEKLWNKALNVYDLSNSVSKSGPHPGIMKALQRCELLNVLEGYLQGHLFSGSELSAEVLEYQSECAWRLGQWDLALPESTAVGFHRSVYESLNCLNTKEGEGFKRNIETARCIVVNSLHHNSMESTRSIYPALSQLKMLKILDDCSQVLWGNLSFSHILEKWEWDSLLPTNDFEFLEPVSWLQCVFLQQQLGTKSSLLEGLIKCLKRHAKIAREEGFLETAQRAIHQLNNLPVRNTDTTLYWQVEEVKIYLKRSENVILKHLLRSLLSKLQKRMKENPELISLYAETLMVNGQWLAETCSSNSATIVDDYLNKAVDILREASDLSDKTVLWDAHLALARYADSHYQRCVNYTKSSAYQAKKELMIHSYKESEMIHKTGPSNDDETRYAKIAFKQSRIDAEELEAVEKDKLKFLKNAMINYLKCLQGTDIHDIRVFRIIALWFQNSERNEINTLVQGGIQNIQSYKFLPLIFQLAARMGTQPSGTFPSTLSELIQQMCSDHPYHTLPVILAVCNADKDPKDSNNVHQRRRKETHGHSSHYDINKDRIAASNEVISKLKNSELKQVIAELETLCLAYISLAYASGPGKPAAGVPIKIPPNEPILKLRNLCIPIITEEIKVNRHCDYKNIPSISHFQPDFRYCGGITAPKAITCVGNDGKSRIQLAKGKDDLRQDAVMQQVFSLVNCLLRQNSATKKRKLSIRTYKVVPLSRRSGVLQWCDGTQQFSEYLIGSRAENGAHSIYYPDDRKIQLCRNAMMEVSKKSFEMKKKVFIEICQNLHPVFRYFFLEHFPQPSVWFERRLAYTRSVATNSIVGYILGLGDRHVNNILIDKITAEFIHIDFGIAFEKGKILPTPETVPFRLTRDVVDGMGVSGVEGIFKRCCEKVLEVMRNSQEILLTILEVLLYDPLYDWMCVSKKVVATQNQEGIMLNTPPDKDTEVDCQEVNKLAERALMRVQQKLQGIEEGVTLSVSGHVNLLVQEATNIDNLCRLYPGWQPYL